jgi:hypothetical protein
MMQPSTDWKEIVPAGEAERFERLGEQVRDLQRKHARGGGVHRGLHAKAQAGLEAEFTVLPDLPEPARQGLFAQPATYRACVRFSNGSGVPRPDAKPDVRGIAIKILGVPGRKVIPSLEDATTQDFLLILTPSTPFRNAEEFVWFVVAMQRPALLLPRLLLRFGPARALRLLRSFSRLGKPVTSLATRSFYSALPIRFGPYAVHLSLEPQAKAGETSQPGLTRDYLGEELSTRLAAGPVIYDVRIQFFVDEERTPIEDASREWKEEAAPWITVGRLTLPRQETGSPRGRRVAEVIERLSFDPWHALVDHRPLGDMMRARNVAYRLSTQERGAAPEPAGGELFE